MASKSFIDLAGLQHYDEKLNEAIAAEYVNLSGTQTISGAKTFTSTINGTRFNGAVSAYKIDTSGTESTAGSIPFVARPLVDESRSCKTAFLPAANVTIEYSINGGSTWADYGSPDSVKADLFAMNRGSSVSVGKGTAGGTSAVDTNCKLRITFNANGRYAAVDNLYLYVTSFNHTMKVDIEKSTVGATTTFTNVRAGVTVSGWGGPNFISLPSNTFGSYNSGQTGNGYAYRLTFYCTAIGANTTSYPSVHDIRLYGTTTWTAANTMMNHDSLYSWDRDQNAAFPAQITATQFNGPATIVAPLPPAALPDTTLAVDGLQVVEVYNNSYPYAYGNVINVQGTKHRGAGQLMLGWSGSSNGIANIYYRNKRDAASTWSAWKTIAFTDSSITGTAANVTGTVAVANGGTGATTAEDALTNLGAAASGHTHSYLPLSGGTLTGQLSIKSSSSFVNLFEADLTKGTNPSTGQWSGIYLCDKTGNSTGAYRLAALETCVGSDGLVATYMRSYNWQASSSSSACIAIYYPQGGTPYTEAPTPDASDNSTKIATTAWARSATGNFACNAATASKLGTSTVGAADRPIYLNAGTAAAVNSALKTCYGGVESEAVSNTYFKIGTGSISGSYNHLKLRILVQHLTGGNSCVWDVWLASGSTAGVYSSGHSILFDSTGYYGANLIAAYKSNSGGSLDFELYVKEASRYSNHRFTVIQECWRNSQKVGDIVTLTNQLTSTGTAAITSGYTAMTTANATVSMNINGSATKATQDGSGNNIVNTYATKSELADIISVTTAQIDTLFA